MYNADMFIGLFQRSGMQCKIENITAVITLSIKFDNVLGLQ